MKTRYFDVIITEICYLNRIRLRIWVPTNHEALLLCSGICQYNVWSFLFFYWKVLKRNSTTERQYLICIKVDKVKWRMKNYCHLFCVRTQLIIEILRKGFPKRLFLRSRKNHSALGSNEFNWVWNSIFSTYYAAFNEYKTYFYRTDNVLFLNCKMTFFFQLIESNKCYVNS